MGLQDSRGGKKMEGRRKIPLLKRPVDIVVVLCDAYFLFSCIFIERHYCAGPLQEDDSDFLLRATYEYAVEYNPLFLSRPEWLQAATCMSAYVLGVGYIVGVYTFLMGNESFRDMLLLFTGFKLYAIGIYWYLELFGSMPAPDMLMFAAPEITYLFALGLVMFRLRSQHPFTEPIK